VRKALIVLSDLPESSIVWKNSLARVRDIGDGILAVSWTSKMNTIGAEVIQGLNKAIDLAEAGYKGLVVYNDGALFSAGANVGMIFMMAVEQEYDDLDMAIRTFQNTMMRMRHSSIPVVAAPHQLCLGGGTELCLHADKVVAHAETYMGLVEFGVGVIPGGGGSKEFALRLSDELKEGDIRINALRERFLTIGQAKVSTSGEEAFALGYLRRGTDEVIVSRAHQLAYAKECALDLWEKGLHQAAHAQGHQGARPRRPGHRVHRRQHHAERQLHQRARHADLAEAGTSANPRKSASNTCSAAATSANPRKSASNTCWTWSGKTFLWNSACSAT
jgi:3-hydroxyacyl-CoA dehydrogenase